MRVPASSRSAHPTALLVRFSGLCNAATTACGRLCPVPYQGTESAENHADRKRTKKDAHKVAQREHDVAKGDGAAFEDLQRLKEDNGDGVVEDALTKDDGEELWVHMHRVEDGQHRHCQCQVPAEGGCASLKHA